MKIYRVIKILPWRFQVLVNKFFAKHSWTLSQAGQDLWVFGEAFNEKSEGFFLDIGAHDGVDISNTYLLEHRYNWAGICIEANPVTFEVLKRNRRSTCVNACLDSKEGEVEFALRGVLGGIIRDGLDNIKSHSDFTTHRIPTTTLLKVLKEHEAPTVIDYLSIDVEGAEETILASFPFEHYRFNCITIERPSEMLRKLFVTHGYVLIKEISGLDCFYVHRQYMDEYKRNLFDFYEKKHLALRWS
jgi:FkbM family methyltransferase